MKTGRWRMALLLVLLLLETERCRGTNDTSAPAPLVMTITMPTSQAIYSTDDPVVAIGGTIAGMQPADLLPFGNGGVRNETTEQTVSITIQGSGAWHTEPPISLTFGSNLIHAYIDVLSGFSEDGLTITRN